MRHTHRHSFDDDKPCERAACLMSDTNMRTAMRRPSRAAVSAADAGTDADADTTLLMLALALPLLLLILPLEYVLALALAPPFEPR